MKLGGFADAFGGSGSNMFNFNLMVQFHGFILTGNAKDRPIVTDVAEIVQAIFTAQDGSEQIDLTEEFQSILDTETGVLNVAKL